ncbi:murein biosynthesis integral membrane protein MurJ [Patescibacteria group bacterium]
MVKRILNLLNIEISGLHEAAYLLGLFTFLSQVLALFRDKLLAHSFGAGDVLDMYYSAFRIPDFVFISVASIVSISVLIPFLVKKIDSNFVDSRKFIDSIFSLFIISIIAVSIVLFFLVPYINRIILPGFSESSISQISLMTRILLLSPILLGISNLFAGITQVHRRFLVYALSPLLYNLGIIVGILFFYPIWGNKGLVFGVIFGALMHLLVQIPSVSKVGFLPRFTFNILWRDIKEVVMLSLPRALTLASSQIILIFLIGFASVMTVGSISVFNFSLNLQSVPLAIIGVSYSVAAFPTLSRLFSSGNEKKFLSQIVTATRHIIFWSIPTVVLFVVLRAQIVRVILGSGEFSWSDTRLTAASLALFALSVTAQSLVLLFVRGYYATGNTKKPLIINMFSALITICLTYLLYNLFLNTNTFKFFLESLFRVDGLVGTDVLILPLSYSLGSILNMSLLWISFQKNFKKFSLDVLETFVHSLSSAVIMGFVAYQFLVIFGNVFDINTFWGILSQGFLSGIIGIMVGIFILKLLKNKELSEIQKAIHKKFWKTEAVIPEQRRL